MQELLDTLNKVVQEKGFNVVTDAQTKEVLLQHKKGGFRFPICTVNRLPQDLGFLFKDSADIAKLIAGFITQLSTQKVEEEEQPDLVLQQLSQMEELKMHIRDSIIAFIRYSESPVLRDTVVGMLSSLAIEFNVKQPTSDEE